MAKRVAWLVGLMFVACVGTVRAQCPSMSFPATGGGYYVVVVDGDTVSQHTTERGAVARGATEKLRNPAAVVTYNLSSVTRVEGCFPTGRVDTLVVRDTLWMPSDTVVIQVPVPTFDTVIVTVTDTVYLPTPTDTVVVPPVDTTPPPPPIDTTTPPPPPPVDTVGPVNGHPRVWMTPERVAFLKAQRAAGSYNWGRTIATADAQVARGTAYASTDHRYIGSVCLAYLATDDQRYADRAAVVLTGYVSDPANDLRYDSGYGFRFAMPLTTMGLDWCYAGLGVATRQAVAGWLMDRADWVWTETNPVIDGGQNKRYAIDRPTNNYWWGFVMTGPAALAASDDDPRGTYHIALGRTRWAEAEAGFFDTFAEGGASVEGTGYDVAWYVGRFADAYFTAGQPVTTPWLEASLRYRIQMTMPGGQFLVPFGDQARVSAGSFYAYDRMRALTVLDAANASPLLRGQIQYWLGWIGQAPYSENGTGMLADEMLRYDPSAPVTDLSSLPRFYLAPGMGQFIYRDSWTDPTTTAFAYSAGPYREAHQSAAANALLIWKGSYWVSGNANIYSASGIRWESIYHNTMTASEGQTRSGSPGGTILTNTVTDTLVVIRSQAAAAYRNGVSDFLRSVAYLPDLETFVVVDRVTATVPYTIRWHSKGTPVVSGNQFTITNPGGDQRCVGMVAGATLGTEAINLGNSGALSSYAVTLTSPNASDVTVTILQCGAVTGNVSIQRDAAGVTATIGTVAVRVPNDEQGQVTR